MGKNIKLDETVYTSGLHRWKNPWFPLTHSSCCLGGDDLNQSGNKSDLLDDEEDFFDFISRYSSFPLKPVMRCMIWSVYGA